MNKIEAVIFDMDGTLYTFPETKKFAQTEFGKTIKSNILKFIEESFSLRETDARRLYDDLSARWQGEISLAIEAEYGIPRDEFFASTWNLAPEKFIIPKHGLVDALSGLAVPTALLTAAPRIWAERALAYMEVRKFFDDRIFTGEPDIRKPDVRVFQQIAQDLGCVANKVVSIGDQEMTDIVPAKLIGMKTIRIWGDEPSAADAVVPSILEAIALVNDWSRYED